MRFLFILFLKFQLVLLSTASTFSQITKQHYVYTKIYPTVEQPFRYKYIDNFDDIQ